MLGFMTLSGVGFLPAGATLISRALELARHLRDIDTYWFIASLWLPMVSGPQHDEERLRLAEELVEQSQTGVDLAIRSWTLWVMVHTFLEFGQPRRAEDIMAEMKTLAERSGQPHLLIMSMLNDATMAIWYGRLEQAIEIRRRVLARAKELDIFEFAAMWTAWILPARVYLGDAGRALGINLQGTRNVPRNIGAEKVILFCLVHLGRHAEVAEMLERLVVARPGIGSVEDETPVWIDITLLEVAVLAGHRQAADLLLNRLAGSSSHTSGLWLTTCKERHLGAAASLLGRPDEARKYYEEAIRACTEMKFRPELALTRLQLAELLLEHFPKERAEALEHLDFAINEFREMKMQPSLERALKHKDILKA